MKKIIPAVTNPPDAPVGRTHEPETANWKGGYGEYRPCLRWEFGFTCAFCLLHESDLNEFGSAEGWAVTSVEHRKTQKSALSEANDYKNCYYACRFCNGSRATKPLTNHDGTGVLDPCSDTWSKHFIADTHRLDPTTKEGEYTRDVYDLNDPRRVLMRQNRAENIKRWRELILERPKAVEQFTRVAEELLRSDKFSERTKGQFLMEQAHKQLEDIRHARKAIERYLAIPIDHDTKCRCSNVSLKLPDEIEKQLVEFPT